jgi:unsaturated rhamnogalacturonyl hydrolase
VGRIEEGAVGESQDRLSSQFWGRGVGWYAMGVADVLAEMPKDHPKRAAVIAVLRRLATAIARVQDPATGVWWQVLDAAGRPGNYLEASASAMFVYALTKGVGKAGSTRSGSRPSPRAATPAR